MDHLLSKEKEKKDKTNLRMFLFGSEGMNPSGDVL